MHEFSIASQIWESVARAAREQGGRRVLSVTLEIGALNLLGEEQLRFWIEELAARDGSPEVELKIKTLPGRVRCKECGEEREAVLPPGETDHFVAPVVSCRECGSGNVRIVGGREIRVVSAEIERDGAEGTG